MSLADVKRFINQTGGGYSIDPRGPTPGVNWNPGPGIYVQPKVPQEGGGPKLPDMHPMGGLPDVLVNPGTQPPVAGDGTPGAGTGSDPFSTLAAAYMASLGGGAGGSGGTAPIVIPAGAQGEGTGVNWAMIGALAAVALVVWAMYTWWKKRHGGGA